jgi:hypothetical protein
VVEALTTDDDEMDPVLTWEDMRGAYYRSRLGGR